MKRICVIGGGASGLVAAICAAKGAEVTVFEKKEQLGKKLLSTGNGKCNIINADQSVEHFHSTEADLALKLLDSFNEQEILNMFYSLGLMTYSKNGYYYPLSDQAATVVRILTDRLSELKVNIRLKENVKAMAKRDNIFKVVTDLGEYRFDRVIISVGSPAGLSVRENYNGIELIKNTGHKLLGFKPVLCGLLSEDKITKYWSGIRTEARIGIYKGEKLLRSELGELMLAEDGISGIPAFQLSHYYDANMYVIIDFLPGLDSETIVEFLINQKKHSETKKLYKTLCGLLNSKLAESLVTEAVFRCPELKGYKAFELNLASLSLSQLRAIARLLKSFRVNLTGTRSYKDSQACRGGVLLSEINIETCESKKIPGLYFTGEYLDMAGDCGGYNLQWAWATGVTAGRAARK